MSKLKPQNGHVVLRPIEEQEQTYGNIVIPDMGKEKPEMGEIVSVGPGRQSEFGGWIEVKAKVGDMVLIPKSATIQFDFEGQEYYITPDREILATVLESQD
jgi:chaperonin GroES